MKKMFFILFLSLDVADAGLRYSEDDKKAHTLGSYALTQTTAQVLEKYNYSLGERILYASMLTTAVGLIKESYIDKRYDKNDVLANTVGIGASAVFTWTIDGL